VDKVARVLGAGLYLKPLAQAKSFYTHAGNATGQDYWQTPPELLDIQLLATLICFSGTSSYIVCFCRLSVNFSSYILHLEIWMSKP
jgi:hypothetical protein